MQRNADVIGQQRGFSTLQRVEIAEIQLFSQAKNNLECFSTLQRVEIAEIWNRLVSGGRLE